MDALARQYMAKYFDAPAPAGKAGKAAGGKGAGKGGKQAAASAAPTAALKRWFD